jgi:hypothetical protein
MLDHDRPRNNTTTTHFVARKRTMAMGSNNLKTETLATEFQKITYTEEARTPEQDVGPGPFPDWAAQTPTPTSVQLPEDRG